MQATAGLSKQTRRWREGRGLSVRPVVIDKGEGFNNKLFGEGRGTIAGKARATG